MIHPTAIVHPTAVIGEGAEIGPFCVVGENVVVGKRTKLLAHVVVNGRTTIGEDARIHPFCSIGAPSQDRKYHGELSYTTIGDRTEIREYVSVNRATGEGEVTSVGNDSLLLAYVHIAHNCRIGERVTMSSTAQLAGHVIVNVVASAFFSAVEPVSLSHDCVHSDEVTTVDLDSGKEQVGVKQGRPELNPAGTSAGTRLWKIHKSLPHTRLGLEARVGIGL